MRDKDDLAKVEVQSREALWSWLGENHHQVESVWLVTWKAEQRDKYVSRDQVLDALIAHGWIDGRRMKLDALKTMQLISPRKQQVWAKTYKERAARLEQEGLMLDAGRAAIARSKALGQWDALDHVDALEEPDDLVQALVQLNARDWWDNAAPSYKRNILRWIATAKKDTTRANRIALVSEHAQRGSKVPNY